MLTHTTALFIAMSFPCSFCGYNLASSARELGQHTRFCGEALAAAASFGGGAAGGGRDGASGAKAAAWTRDDDDSGRGVGGGGGGGGSYAEAMDLSHLDAASVGADEGASSRGGAGMDVSFVEEVDWEGDGGSVGAPSVDSDSFSCSSSAGSSESALPLAGAAPPPPPAPPADFGIGGALRAGTQRGRDALTLDLLSPPGVTASVELYGVLTEQGVSGNGYEAVVQHLYANHSFLQTAVETGTLLRTATAVRGKIEKALNLQGMQPPSKEFLLLKGAGSEPDTLASLSRCDVMAQLREHLLTPELPSPPLQDPAFVHLFSTNDNIDNMANSKAGLEFNASLQAAWREKGAAASGWSDPLHRLVEQQYPGKTHHLHVVQACVFIDGFAASEGMKSEFYQGRIKLCTAHPELSFLTSTYLLSGIAKKLVFPERASDETRMRNNDLHAEMWAKLGWDPFFTEKFVALSHSEVSHLGLPSLPGDVHIFKLALLGLLLDNGEVRSVVGTQGCLLCNELTKDRAPVPPAPAAQCPLCKKSHAPHPPDGRRFDLALQQWEIIATFKPGGVVASAGGPTAPPLSAAKVAEHATYVAEAKQSLSNLGFNSDISVPALSSYWLPARHLKYFAWGGAIAALCGSPLLCFMFECVKAPNCLIRSYSTAISPSAGVYSPSGWSILSRGWSIFSRMFLTPLHLPYLPYS